LKTFINLFVLVALFVFGQLANADDAKKIKVACIGDSITKGDGLEEEETYPYLLGKRLGKQYEVKNFGCPAATATATGDRPYVKTKECKDALEFQPDMVIIMLGTNDSKDWKKKDKIEEGYKALVAEFQKLPIKPKVILCTPPCVTQDNWGIEGEIVKEGIRPLVKKVGEELKLPVVDVFRVSDGKEIHIDGIHLNAEGAKLVAETVRKKVIKTK
jgi:lysophospholipase L1-like esterase